MSNPGDEDATPIVSTAQLAEYLARGCKPPERWRIGTEHEKFGFYRSDDASPPYAPGADRKGGIHAVLDAIEARGGWAPIADQGSLIGLKGLAGGEQPGASISLEPGGQFELSGAPLVDLHETGREMTRHFAATRAVADPLGIGFAPLGFHPVATRADIPMMPKSRYGIMWRYMPLVGTRGADMMLRTCTVQVNLDYASEADMARKMRVSLALQPVATALFANSPFYEGRPNGLLSNRAQVWTDVDNVRSGMPALFFEDGFGFERYVEWVLDVPMYFAARDGRLIDVAGASFRDWMRAGRSGRSHEALRGIEPTIGDFADHLTTVFTDVRLKHFLEMRGADAGSPAMMLAQSALWVGLLYDDAALAAAEALVREHRWSDYPRLRLAVPEEGLGAQLTAGATARDLARAMLAIAGDGLAARAAAGIADERPLLAPLHEIVAGGPNQAEHWLSRYHGEWGGNVRHIFAEAAI